MEAITIKRKDNNCEVYSDLHSMKLGERDINTLKQIIPNIHRLEEGTTEHYEIKNETLREIGLNNHALSKPIGLRNKRQKR